MTTLYKYKKLDTPLEYQTMRAWLMMSYPPSGGLSFLLFHMYNAHLSYTLNLSMIYDVEGALNRYGMTVIKEDG